METQNIISLEIPCPVHPSETIQRVAMDKNANQHLYCLECILQQKSNPKEISQTLKPIAELIDAAASLYAKTRENVSFEAQIPYEMADILSCQAGKLETLSHHIEEEKRRVCEIFDSLSQEFLKIIEEKKTKALSKLDQQIFNLKFWFISFDKQLKKTYPTPEDIPVLYPTKEDLINKLEKISNATQLTALVKSIKDDLHEATASSLVGNERTLDLKKKTAIHNLSKQLLEIAQMRPSYKKEESDLKKLKQDLQEKVSGLMKQTWKIQKPIPEVRTGLIAESTFLKAEDFTLIKSWLPQNLVFNPQLLYRASRDGMDGPSFHKFCDGKENTITVIKAKFQNSNKIDVLGGYLDKPWHSNGGWIESTDSFIFSVTKNVKCPQGNKGAQYGAAAQLNQGPCFGGGYDIGVWTQGLISSVFPFSYENTSQLTENSVPKGSRTTMAPMQVLDVEVYSVN